MVLICTQKEKSDCAFSGFSISPKISKILTVIMRLFPLTSQIQVIMFYIKFLTVWIHPHICLMGSLDPFHAVFHLSGLSGRLLWRETSWQTLNVRPQRQKTHKAILSRRRPVMKRFCPDGGAGWCCLCRLTGHWESGWKWKQCDSLSTAAGVLRVAMETDPPSQTQLQRGRLFLRKSWY